MDKLPQGLQDFIINETWIFAKTYAKTWPHEYLVKEKVDEKLFIAFVHLIREQGYTGKFYEKDIIYFDYNNDVFWTMGSPIPETIIINRCKKEQSYEYRLKHNLLPD